MDSNRSRRLNDMMSEVSRDPYVIYAYWPSHF